ncbi:MAG: protein-L-isoaspartate(D-aspartate) O-methyltransferase [Nitrososphaerota archaeon]|nr:protein-L-isoaspartate(D-aspartate) O-methyltransferase [Nitrososphaerota archaeon]
MAGPTERLVERLKRAGLVRSAPVERALLAVRREDFVWPGQRPVAYEDVPLPLGDSGQTLSAPHVVAAMLEELELRPGLDVLEVGTGSGYNAALVAELVGPGGRVLTVERLASLAGFARENLRSAGYGGLVEVVVGDGSRGHPPESGEELYDRIAVTACAPSLPPPLKAQLRRGGVVVAPLGGARVQELRKFRKGGDGELSEERPAGKVVFVPLVGRYGYPEDGAS